MPCDAVRAHDVQASLAEEELTATLQQIDLLSQDVQIKELKKQLHDKVSEIQQQKNELLELEEELQTQDEEIQQLQETQAKEELAVEGTGQQVPTLHSSPPPNSPPTRRRKVALTTAANAFGSLLIMDRENCIKEMTKGSPFSTLEGFAMVMCFYWCFYWLTLPQIRSCCAVTASRGCPLSGRQLGGDRCL